MGMFKRMKAMKDMIESDPGMVAQVQQLGAQAQQVAAAQQAAYQAQAMRAAGPQPVGAEAGADLEQQGRRGIRIRPSQAAGNRGVAGWAAGRLADRAPRLG